MSPSVLRRAALVLLAILALAVAPMFADSSTEKGENKTASSQAKGEADAAAAARTPGTGATDAASPLKGTDLARMLNRDMSVLVIRRNPAGGTIVDIKSGFRDVMVAQIGPDGQPTVTCIASEKAAERMLARDQETRKP